MIMIDFGSDENADWLKTIVNPKTGKTYREEELAIHDTLAQQITVKHQPGRHDQKSHGRGRTSGSLPAMRAYATGLIGAERVDIAAANAFLTGVATFDNENDENPSNAVTGHKVSQYDDIDRFEVTDDERSMWKRFVIQDLAKQSGLSFDRVNELIATWADTSNDRNPTSMGLQVAANEEFDAPLSEWQKGLVGIMEGDFMSWNEYGDVVDKTLYAPAKEDGRKLLRAMYNKTQQELQEAGVEEVVLYRGVRYLAEAPIKQYEIETIRENAVESWSLSHNVAVQFAENPQGMGEGKVLKEYGMVIQAVVPRERILSTAKTGFGCLSEYEFTVLGSAAEDEVRVVNVRR